MKNYIYKILCFATIFLVAINVKAQDRNVVWVHGLGDNASFWQHYDNIFEAERKTNGLRNTYSTSYGITYAANRVKASMANLPNNGSTDPNNIGIGHSLGGLIIRDVDRTSSNFGGLITVTTPNEGAPIANAIKDGSVDNAVANALLKLKAGPLSEQYFLPWQITPILNSDYLAKLFLKNQIVEDYTGSPQTITDLKTGSTAINNINNYPSSIPRISIWAEENSPVHWRTLSSKLYGNDSDLVNQVNNARGVYNNLMHYNQVRAVANSFWNPFLAAKYSYRARQWKKGRDWIDDSETIWSSLIKTTRTEPQTYWVEVWVPCDNDPYPMEKTINTKAFIPAPDPNCGEWEWQEHTRYVTVNYPSDGILPQYTQELDGIPYGNKYHIVGANHLEVGDMSSSSQGDLTRDRFNQIFDRPQGDFFRTAKSN